MSIKSFITGLILKRQLKHLPKDQQEIMIKVINENPEFFKKINDEIKHKEKYEGKDKTAAMFEVMRKHQGEMQKLMMGK